MLDISSNICCFSGRRHGQFICKHLDVTRSRSTVSDAPNLRALGGCVGRLALFWCETRLPTNTGIHLEPATGIRVDGIELTASDDNTINTSHSMMETLGPAWT